MELCELNGPTSAALDAWASLRSGDRVASVFSRFGAFPPRSPAPARRAARAKWSAGR